MKPNIGVPKINFDLRKPTFNSFTSKSEKITKDLEARTKIEIFVLEYVARGLFNATLRANDSNETETTYSTIK